MGTKSEEETNGKTTTRKEKIEAEKTDAKKSGGEEVVLTIKQLITSFGALNYLAEKPLTIKMTYRISKALGKVKAEVEKYNEAVSKFIKDLGGTPGPNGYEIRKGDDNYDEKMLKLTEYSEEGLKQEVTLTGILQFSLEDILSALPATVVKGDKNNPSASDLVEDKPRLEPFVLNELDWLFTEPEEDY